MLLQLREESGDFPGVADGRTSSAVEGGSLLFLLLHLRLSDGSELSLFSTIATFGTAVGITVAELSIETYPAAAETAAIVAYLPGSCGPVAGLRACQHVEPAVEEYMERLAGIVAMIPDIRLQVLESAVNGELASGCTRHRP